MLPKAELPQGSKQGGEGEAHTKHKTQQKQQKQNKATVFETLLAENGARSKDTSGPFLVCKPFIVIRVGYRTEHGADWEPLPALNLEPEQAGGHVLHRRFGEGVRDRLRLGRCALPSPVLNVNQREERGFDRGLQGQRRGSVLHT